MLTDKSLRDVLSAFASPDPTPGGGSAAAMASATGAALLVMVAGLPKTRGNTDQDRAALAGVKPSLEQAARELTAAIDADSAAYDGVVAAYRLPKGAEPEQSARKQAIQRAMREATDVPLQVMRLSSRALEAAQTVAAHAHRPAASDAGVAIALLLAGLEGAHLNVSANLSSVADDRYAQAVKSEVERLNQASRSNADGARRSLLG